MNVIDIINNIDNDLKALIINVLGGVITTILIFAMGKFFKLVPQIMKQKKSWFLLLLVNIFLFFMIFINDDLTKAIVAFMEIFLLEVVSLSWIGKKEKEILSLKNRELPKDARYFIGIDVGRSTINYCLVDYEEFGTNDDGIVCDKDGKKIVGKETSPENVVAELSNTLVRIICNINDKAQLIPILPIQISGIGIGLPGQVDPIDGDFDAFPGDIKRNDIEIVKEIKEKFEEKKLANLKNIDIKIDNDARCATRYIWKKKNEDNFVCLLIGNGLGSGIVLNNNIIYGSHFRAGEIGHTTISRFFLESEEIHNKKIYKVCGCMSKKREIPNQCHLEMYVSGFGLVNIAKNLDNAKYEAIKKDYQKIIEEDEFKKILEEEKLDKKKLYSEREKELTSYFISIAFRVEDEKINEYPKEVVKKFFEYLGIGLANYSNTLDIQRIYLAGGMINGFYSKVKGCSFNTDECQIDIVELVRKYWEDHAIGAITTPVKLEEQQREIVASVGAALIFQDQSYFNYIGKK